MLLGMLDRLTNINQAAAGREEALELGGGNALIFSIHNVVELFLIFLFFNMKTSQHNDITT